ncbi:MAG: 2-amino-4-hydroxy-6-hydroxymethyldihydropteridine diphosphokinase [Candidatus Cloacimonetes bacterium]|nr:2-amino-4-hydroxy-6-hydroxymethyldihydropteridine diphosphokinase [Candidatus Cloacimonadota bacterium]
MSEMICYLGLGSNLGNREVFISKALTELSKKMQILQNSKIIETKPYGNVNQPDFLNCVIKIETELKPDELLKICTEIENKLGRKRTQKWASRTIDIDILFYGTETFQSDKLTIPHPEIQKRKFVLKSLNEICPDLMHPVLNMKISQILLECK